MYEFNKLFFCRQLNFPDAGWKIVFCLPSDNSSAFLQIQNTLFKQSKNKNNLKIGNSAH